MFTVNSNAHNDFWKKEKSDGLNISLINRDYVFKINSILILELSKLIIKV